MFQKLKNLILNEFFYLVTSGSIVLAMIVTRGIFFEQWYKDWDKIGFACIIIYGLTLIYRSFAWINRKTSRKSEKKDKVEN